MNELRKSDKQGFQDIDYRCKSDEFCNFCVHRINQDFDVNKIETTVNFHILSPHNYFFVIDLLSPRSLVSQVWH